MMSLKHQEIGKAIFQESPDALLLFDPDTERVLDVNPSAIKLSGFTREQLLEHPVTHWVRFSQGDKGGDQRMRQAAAQTAKFFSHDGYYLRTPNEKVWVPVNLSISRLHITPKPLALMTARDMRAQRDADEQLRRQTVRLREGEVRLQTIMDHSPAVIYVKDVQGRYLLINRQFEELFHTTREQVRGKTDFDIFPEQFAAVFTNNDRKVLAAGKPIEYEEIAPHDDGPHTYISIKFPVRDSRGNAYALCGISTDITERKRLADERDRIFTLSLDMLCVAGFDGYFKRVNPAWESTLGWSTGQLLSKPYLEFVHAGDREKTVEEARRLAAGNYQTTGFENRYVCADGTCRWLQWSAVASPADQLIYAVARDVTDFKQAQDRLARSTAELANTYERTKKLAGELEQAVASEREAHRQLKVTQSHLVHSEKMIALGQTVAGVAHEINNPLAFVMNNAAVVERDVAALRELVRHYQRGKDVLRSSPEIYAAIESLENAIDADYILANLDGLFARSRDGLKRIQRIVKDLRDFARLDEGDKAEVDLNAGVNSTINIVRGQARKKNVEIAVDLAKLPRVMCHAAKINQVVLNLLTNAIDATPPSGRILVRTCADAAAVQIHISDTGPGIPDAIREKIFDPFFTTKPPGKGTGLGLSISHGIVADHSGRIWIEPASGQGAHFVIELPI